VTSWRAAHLLSVPHRLAFVAGAFMMGLAAAWWLGVLLASHQGGVAPRQAFPLAWGHALVMTLGFMPMFFAGFVFTAGPRWLKLPVLSGHLLRWHVVVWLLVWPVFLLGMHVNRLVSAVALLGAAVVWAHLTIMWHRLVQASRVPDRLHARLMVVAFGSGVFALGAASLAVAVGSPGGVSASVMWGLWGFVLPVYLVAGHRLIPLFDLVRWPWLDARWPHALLWSLLSVSVLGAVRWSSESWGMLWGAPWAWTQALCSVLGGLGLLALSVRWACVQNMRLRMLAMLNIGVVWLGLAWILAGVSGLAAVPNRPSWALMALHALSMGFMGSVWLAMASRVSSTQEGHAIAADDWVWGLFWVLLTAVISRLSAIVWPTYADVMLTGAACLWLSVALGWLWRYGRWFGLAPRPGITARTRRVPLDQRE
jgi:uncharacterized protein involved in response to NO